MRAAAQQDRACRAEEQGLAHHVVAGALAIPLRDECSGAHRLAQPRGPEQLPLLLRMEVPDEVREIPVLEERVALGMKQQSWRHLPIERVAVSRAGFVQYDALRVDLVLVAAEVLADDDGFGRRRAAQSTASATVRKASGCWRARIIVVIPDSFHSASRSRIRSLGPHSVT